MSGYRGPGVALRSTPGYHRSPLRGCKDLKPIRSRPVFPPAEVLLLLRRELVDRHAHRGELLAGDVLLDLQRHVVDLGAELALVADAVFGGERLRGEAHVHD